MVLTESEFPPLTPPNDPEGFVRGRLAGLIPWFAGRGLSFGLYPVLIRQPLREYMAADEDPHGTLYADLEEFAGVLAGLGIKPAEVSDELALALATDFMDWRISGRREIINKHRRRR